MGEVGLINSKPKYRSKLRLGTPVIAMFYYVYILQSEKHPDRFYTGFTENLEDRLDHHNRGQCPRSSKYKPWRIKTAIAFTDREKALDFERYLKTPSRRAFAIKRL